VGRFKIFKSNQANEQRKVDCWTFGFSLSLVGYHQVNETLHLRVEQLMHQPEITIELLSVAHEQEIVDLIRGSIAGYLEAGGVLGAMYRRLNNFYKSYQSDGAFYWILLDKNSRDCIGGAGIGPLHGLPRSEGLGEVRDLVLNPEYRGYGYGAKLLKRCIDEAKALGYRSLYLETTPDMVNAQKLFLRTGFRPITQAQEVPVSNDSTLPGYYLIDLKAAET
jgi:putative acetyltransferase